MNRIHPTAILEGDVRLGQDNEILPYTVLIGPLTIGNNNIIGPHVVIGGRGQDTRNPRYDASKSPIVIGNDNIIREFTGIQKPCYQDVTQLGHGIHLMQSVHIPHDAVIEDHVVITPMVVLAGITRIMTCSNLGMGATIHQYSVVGPYSIVATGAAVVKNVKPFSRMIPGKPVSLNQYAIDKYGFSDLNAEIAEYVLENKLPKSPRLQSIVESYLRLHRESKRSEYL